MDRRTLEHFLTLCEKPKLGLNPANYDSVCTYIMGWDQATSCATLEGFWYWLKLRTERTENFGWRELVLLEALPNADVLAPLSDTNEHHARVMLSRLLMEFWEERERRGVLALRAAFEKKVGKVQGPA